MKRRERMKIEQTIWDILDHEKPAIPEVSKILNALCLVAAEDTQLARKMALGILDAFHKHANQQV